MDTKKDKKLYKVDSGDIRSVFGSAAGSSLDRRDSNSSGLIKVPAAPSSMSSQKPKQVEEVDSSDDDEDSVDQPSETGKYYQGLLDESREKSKRLADDLRVSEEKREKLENENVDLKEKERSARKLMQTANRETQVVQVKLNAANERIAKLEAELEAAKKSKGAAPSSSSSADAEHAEKVRELRARVATLENELQQLKEQLQGETERAEQLSQTLAVREAGIQRAIVKIKELDAANKKLMEDRAEMDSGAVSKHEELMALRHKVELARRLAHEYREQSEKLRIAEERATKAEELARRLAVVVTANQAAASGSSLSRASASGSSGTISTTSTSGSGLSLIPRSTASSNVIAASSASASISNTNGFSTTPAPAATTSGSTNSASAAASSATPLVPPPAEPPRPKNQKSPPATLHYNDREHLKAVEAEMKNLGGKTREQEAEERYDAQKEKKSNDVKSKLELEAEKQRKYMEIEERAKKEGVTAARKAPPPAPASDEAARFARLKEDQERFAAEAFERDIHEMESAKKSKQAQKDREVALERAMDEAVVLTEDSAAFEEAAKPPTEEEIRRKEKLARRAEREKELQLLNEQRAKEKAEREIEEARNPQPSTNDLAPEDKSLKQKLFRKSMTIAAKFGEAIRSLDDDSPPKSSSGSSVGASRVSSGGVGPERSRSPPPQRSPESHSPPMTSPKPVIPPKPKAHSLRTAVDQDKLDAAAAARAAQLANSHDSSASPSLANPLAKAAGSGSNLAEPTEPYTKVLDSYKKQKETQSSQAAAARTYTDALKLGQKLKVTVVNGSSFPSVCSPYCVIRLGAQSRKTKLLLKVDKEAQWDESLFFDLVEKDKDGSAADASKSGELQIECFVKTSPADKSLGSFKVMLSDYREWGMKKEFLLAQSVLEENNTRSLRVILELSADDDQVAQKRRQTLIEGTTLRGKSARAAGADIVAPTPEAASPPGSFIGSTSSPPGSIISGAGAPERSISPGAGLSRMSTRDQIMTTLRNTKEFKPPPEPVRGSDDVSTPIRAAANCVPIDYEKLAVAIRTSTEPIDVKWRNKNTQTLLHLMAGSPRFDVVTTLINKGSEVEAKDCDGMTAYHFAAKSGAREVLDVLQLFGANLEAVDNWGRTPLMIACGDAQLEMIRALMNKGARADKQDNAGQTVLHKAALSGNLDVVKALADKEGPHINLQDNDGNSPLLLAEMAGKTDIADYLVSKGADIQVQNSAGDSLLWATMLRGDKQRLTRAIKQWKVNPNQLLGAHKFGVIARAILQLEEKDCVELLPLLIQQGVEMDLKNGSDDKTPLHIAAYKGYAQVVKLLLYANAKVDSADRAGNTPLHFVSNVASARLLLDKGAKVNVKNKHGFTSLHTVFAFHDSDPALIDLLIAKGGDSTAQNRFGLTPRELTNTKILRKVCIPFFAADESYPEYGGLYVQAEKEKKDKRGFEVL